MGTWPNSTDAEYTSHWFPHRVCFSRNAEPQYDDTQVVYTDLRYSETSLCKPVFHVDFEFDITLLHMLLISLGPMCCMLNKHGQLYCNCKVFLENRVRHDSSLKIHYILNMQKLSSRHCARTGGFFTYLVTDGDRMTWLLKPARVHEASPWLLWPFSLICSKAERALRSAAKPGCVCARPEWSQEQVLGQTPHTIGL